jgi:ArsR family transcriptional regulator
MTTDRSQTKRVRILKALSHPVRLQIAEILSQEESCVCHLEARLRLRQAYVSQQLGVLREAGLLSERKVGTFIHYRLSDPRLREVILAVQRVAGPDEGMLPPFDPSDCPCPRCGRRTRRV